MKLSEYVILCDHLFVVFATRSRRDIKIPLRLSAPVQILSNDHGRTHKCDFSVSHLKYPLWGDLAQNIKIVSLSWNLIPTLIRICKSVLDRKYSFWANLVQQIKIVSSSWNLVLRLIRVCRIQWWCSLFFVLDWKQPFWSNLVKKIKIFSLS